MNNSLFIEILKHLNSISFINKKEYVDQINEYKSWLVLSQIIYSKEYYHTYVQTLDDLCSLVLSGDDDESIHSYLSETITYFYLMTDENEV